MGYTKFFFISELLFGISFIFLYHNTKNIYFSLMAQFLFGHILISMITDYQKFILDYENLFFIIIIGFVTQYLLSSRFPNVDNLLVGAGFFIFFYTLSILYRGGMGFGDVIYVSAYAGLLSHPLWMFFLNSSYILSIVVSFLLRNKKKRFLRTKIPMGVYYGIGYILTFVLSIHFKFEFGP